MLCGDLNGKEIHKRGDICIRIADSLCCTAETHTTLKSNYTPIKIKKKKKRMNSKVRLPVLRSLTYLVYSLGNEGTGVHGIIYSFLFFNVVGKKIFW